jgi:hypothetical protein
MTQIAALVAPTHVVDQSIRPLAFDLERSNEGASSAATVTLSCFPAVLIPTVNSSVMAAFCPG